MFALEEADLNLDEVRNEFENYSLVDTDEKGTFKSLFN